MTFGTTRISIRSQAKLGTGQGDLSVIFAFMKVLDPTSVVRETEYKNAAEAVGKIPALAVRMQKGWLQGDKLSPEGRAGFVSAAQDLYDSQTAAYDDAVAFYKNNAKALGIDPALVVRNYRARDRAPAKVRMRSPGGTIYEFDAAHADSARAHGYKEAP
jgi:hypothetical protein